jgi:hypothetical protein
MSSGEGSMPSGDLSMLGTRRKGQFLRYPSQDCRFGHPVSLFRDSLCRSFASRLPRLSKGACGSTASHGKVFPPRLASGKPTFKSTIAGRNGSRVVP